MNATTDTVPKPNGMFTVATPIKPSIFFSNGQVKSKIPDEYIKEMQILIDEYTKYKNNLSR